MYDQETSSTACIYLNYFKSNFNFCSVISTGDIIHFTNIIILQEDHCEVNNINNYNMY